MKCSAEAEPLVPWLKLSINRTVFSSSGTVVPPDVMKTNLLLFLRNFYFQLK
jgi:hypothetical protein